MSNGMAAANWKLGEKISVLQEGLWKTFTVAERAADGVNVRDDEARKQFFSEADLRRLFLDRALKRPRALGDMPAQARKRLNASICTLPESERGEARRLSAYATEFVRRGGKGRASKKTLQGIISDVGTKLGDPNPPSWRSLSDKLKNIRDGFLDVRAVMGKRAMRGNRTKRFGDFEAVIDEVIREMILVPVPHTTAEVVSILQGRLKEWNASHPAAAIGFNLHARTVQRRVAALSDYDKILAWDGAKEAAHRFGPVGKAPPSRFALDVVEIDHTPLDVFAVHPVTRKSMGRPYLTVAVDRYSRMVVGFHIGFEEPSYKSVMLCLRQAIAPKDDLMEANGLPRDAWPCFGTMTTLVMDNGREFRGSALDDALAQFFVDKRFCRTGKGKDKGTAERFNKTVNFGLVHTFPGTTFANTKAKKDYDAEKEAVLTIADIRRLILNWIVSDYSRSEHRGIKDTPVTRFLESTTRHPLRLPHDIADLDVLLMPADMRIIQRQGIAMFGVYYGTNHPELGALLREPGRPTECVVKYDPNDLGHIYLLDWRTQTFLGLACPPDCGLAGVTEREFEVDRKLALARKREREALTADSLRAARIERVTTLKALTEAGKAKGRKVARLNGADPEFPGAGPLAEISRLPSPESRPGPRLRRAARNDDGITFTTNPR